MSTLPHPSSPVGNGARPARPSPRPDTAASGRVQGRERQAERGDDVTEVAATRPPAASKALRLTCHTSPCDSSVPVFSFWIENPSGVGS